LNILHIHEKTAIHGGAEVYIQQLQDLLPAYDVNTSWMGIEKSEEGFLVSKFGEVEKLLIKNQHDLFNYLDKELIDLDIDLVNIHNLFYPDVVRFLLNRIPVIKSVHSPVMVCPGRDKFWRFSEKPCTIPYGLHCFYHIYKEGCANRHPKRVKSQWQYVQFEAKEAAFLYKKIVVMSDYMKNGLLECDIPETQILLNPYFTPIVEPTNSSENSEKRLLFIGRLVSSKGPHIMIEALEELLKNNSDIFLDIVGDGLMRGDFETLVKKLGLSEKVIFHGWKSQSEIDQFIRNSYLVLFPSVYPEAFGIVGIEAMMRNKAVVAFDVGGVSTWLKDGENGFLVPNKDKKGFSEKVKILIEDDELKNQMSFKARLMVMESFTPEVHMSKLIETYKITIH